MDKKIYIKPVCEVAEFEIQDSLLLNCSIGVDNTPQDGIEGRTNMNQGFTDILIFWYTFEHDTAKPLRMKTRSGFFLIW